MVTSLLSLYAGDGGSYPECHVAQYPLDLGRKKASVFSCFRTGLLSQHL